MELPRIRFRVASPEKAAEFIFALKESLGEQEKDAEDKYENQADDIFLPMSRKIVLELITSNKLSGKLKAELVKLAEVPLKESSDDLLSELEKIRFMWNNEIEKVYWEELRRLIGNNIKLEEEYNAFISNVVCGAYYGKNEVSIPRYKEGDTNLFIFVLAEEISHIVYWNFLSDNLGIKKDDKIWESGKNGWSLWNISEAIPEYLFIDNKNFSKFGWNDLKRTYSYPWIPKIRKILDPLWNDRKDFKDFLIKAHKKLGLL